jgi:hypothetical protein
MEKVFQSMMPRNVDWLMVSALPWMAMLPAPAAKVPPVGSEEAAWSTG